ncbi:MAG: DUF1501 domain-containing protein [Planctomycetota bacterium]
MFRGHRRDWLKASSALSLGTIPAFVHRNSFADSATAERPDGRVLVVIQMSGGNDGLNTVVPFQDEIYRKYRPNIALERDELLRLSDTVGLHPSMRDAAELVEDGRMAIIQGVGYPNPNRSHDVSMAIWQSAILEDGVPRTHGWIGRAMDRLQNSKNRPSGVLGPSMVLLGDEAPPLALQSRRSTAITLSDIRELQLKQLPSRFGMCSDTQQTVEVSNGLRAFIEKTAADAVMTAKAIDSSELARKTEGTDYPGSKLGKKLQSIAQMIKSGFSAPVFYSIQSGYDTHAAQAPTHSRLLRNFSGAVKAFLDDLERAGLADRVVVLGFSEFGRRVKENSSQGTDHGAAGPVFVAGRPVRSGLHGTMPSLADLVDGDIRMNMDFRQVYAKLIQDWFGLEGESSFPTSNEPLRLFRS